MRFMMPMPHYGNCALYRKQMGSVFFVRGLNASIFRSKTNIFAIYMVLLLFYWLKGVQSAHLFGAVTDRYVLKVCRLHTFPDRC